MPHPLASASVVPLPPDGGPGVELVLGGQRSGKSGFAERRVCQWLDAGIARRAVFVATAEAGDEEMRQRIARHRQDRAVRLPGVATVESDPDLARVLRAHDAPGTLLVVDCLTLWLARWLAPVDLAPQHEAYGRAQQDLLDGLGEMGARVLLVSNEIGLGVVPLGAENRAFVDALGRLNQALAQRAHRVTLMVAGLPLVLKGAA